MQGWKESLQYCVNSANYSTAPSQRDVVVLSLFIVTHKPHEVITLFLCLKNKKPLKEKPITGDGFGSEEKVKRPGEVVVLGQKEKEKRKKKVPGEEIIPQRATYRLRNS